MTSFPPINAESGFIAALLIGFLLFIIGHEIAGSLFIIGGVALNYIAFLLLKK
jgi:hypothetical protein